MQRGMILGLMVAALPAAPAHAQAGADHPGVCPRYEREWRAISDGDDAPAMRGALARTPTACPNLRRRISARVAAAERVREQPRPVARSSAPSRPGPARPAPEAPVRPVSFPAPVAGALSPAAYANLERETRRALRYFRPNSVRLKSYGESTGEKGGRNRYCTLRFLPQNAEKATTFDSDFTSARESPFVERQSGQMRLTSCSDRNETRRNESAMGGGARDTLTVSLAHTSLLLTDSRMSTDHMSYDLEMSADLDPSNPAPRTLTYSSAEHDQFGTQQITTREQGSCREVRRWRPGQWNANFPFTIYEMNCQATRGNESGSNRRTQNLYFSPELFSSVACVGPLRMTGLVAVAGGAPPSNVRVSREGNVIRVQCGGQTGETEMVVTLN